MSWTIPLNRTSDVSLMEFTSLALSKGIYTYITTQLCKTEIRFRLELCWLLHTEFHITSFSSCCKYNSSFVNQFSWDTVLISIAIVFVLSFYTKINYTVHTETGTMDNFEVKSQNSQTRCTFDNLKGAKYECGVATYRNVPHNYWK